MTDTQWSQYIYEFPQSFFFLWQRVSIFRFSQHADIFINGIDDFKIKSVFPVGFDLLIKVYNGVLAKSFWFSFIIHHRFLSSEALMSSTYCSTLQTLLREFGYIEWFFFCLQGFIIPVLEEVVDGQRDRAMGKVGLMIQFWGDVCGKVMYVALGDMCLWQLGMGIMILLCVLFFWGFFFYIYIYI